VNITGVVDDIFQVGQRGAGGTELNNYYNYGGEVCFAHAINIANFYSLLPQSIGANMVSVLRRIAKCLRHIYRHTKIME
jgi:hypothetical protein